MKIQSSERYYLRRIQPRKDPAGTLHVVAGFHGVAYIIVHNEIADCELSPPFTYLRRVVESNGSSEMMS
jgi:hypothetical protein